MRCAAFPIGARRGAGRAMTAAPLEEGSLREGFGSAPGAGGAMTAALIEARALGKSFGPTPVLRDVNLSVGAGRGAAVIGANGAGKSTLIRVLAGLSAPTLGGAP